MAGVAALAIWAEPNAGAAHRHIEAGQFDEARADLGALGAPENHAALWAELGLRETMAETDIDQAIERARAIPARMPQAAAAQTHLDRLLVAAATQAIAAQQLAVARERLGQLSESGKDSPEARSAHGEIALADGARCLAESNLSCALQATKWAAEFGLGDRSAALRAQTISALRARAEGALNSAEGDRDLAARVAAQRAAFAAWSDLAAVEPGPEPIRLATVRSAHEKDLVLLAKQEAILRKKQEVADRRAAVEQAKADKKRLAIEAREQHRQAREQRRQEAAERREARASRSLLCNDGSESPSCTCGGSWQGCCSHHGGVAGCQ